MAPSDRLPLMTSPGVGTATRQRIALTFRQGLAWPLALARGVGHHRRWLLIIPFFVFLLLPLWWMLVISLRENSAIITSRVWFPTDATLANYWTILSGPKWLWGFAHTFMYVALNVVFCLVAAVPAAYAFSRWRFRGDSHLFFWLLTNRMAPGAVFATPMLALYSNLHLFDTHWAVAVAHCLFNLPLAIWILEGFMRGIPKEIDEAAEVDGMRFTRFFFTVFLPLIRPGLGVAAFFCFLFSWTELLMAKTLTNTAVVPVVVQMTTVLDKADGLDWGVLAALGVLTMLPGLVCIWFVRRSIVTGFAMGRV